jgi:KUP system potassium uptake protein
MQQPLSEAAQPRATLTPLASPTAHKTPTRVLALGALGVVFGDIGTSPLYAMRECLHGDHGVDPTQANVLGVLSLVFWALTIVVTIKYLWFVLRADNHGEGGILALMALASRNTSSSKARHGIAAMLGLFGAALLYGDGMITPAISVLSAVEGLNVAAPGLKPFVMPLTVAIIIGLFSLQASGSARIGAMFGPVMLVWFSTLGALGLYHLAQEPAALQALNPIHGIQLLQREGSHGLLAMGSVFLVVTGGEALYADMGHFGPRPIRMTWMGLVFPALLLNYFGQGALLLRDPAAATNPFYRMVPELLLYPMIGLATFAAVIASQALITGAFSLTRQAMMLGYCPRFRVVHTSPREIGQIYVPVVNWALMIAAVFLVLGFHTSSGLAAAYGIAVAFTMVITSLLFYTVARGEWGWSTGTAMAVTLMMLVPEIAFLFANMLKIPDGGWFPLMIGGVIMVALTTWKKGRQLVAARFAEQMMPLKEFWARMQADHSVRVQGTAVYMTSNNTGTPPAMLQMYQHSHVVHTQVILLTVITEEIARVPRSRRVQFEEIEPGLVRVVAHYGFVEHPDIPRLLAAANIPGFDPEHTTYFVGRETVIATRAAGMALWRENFFAYMQRNAYPATALFRLPPERVIEVGAQIAI